MANKITRIDFNKERLYEALRMNGINSVRDLCDTNDSLCYGGEFVSRKTIERACRSGIVSIRTLNILSRALDCTPEFFTASDVIVKETSFKEYLDENPCRKQWITVKDLKKLLNYFPDDTMICVDNNEMYNRGTYYATQDFIDFFKVEGVNHLIIGTNYFTRVLGKED